MGAGIWFILIIPLMFIYIIDKEFGTEILSTLEEYFANNPELVEEINNFSIKAMEVIVKIINADFGI